MTVGPWVDRAFVGLLIDDSKFLPGMRTAMDRAMGPLQTQADRAADGIIKSFDRVDDQAAQVFDRVRLASRDATEDVGVYFDVAAARIDRALDGVGDGAFSELKGDARRAADGIETEFEEAGRDADQALDRVDQPGRFRGVGNQAEREGDRVSRAFRSSSISAGASLGALRVRAFGAGAVIAGALGTIGTAAATMGIQAAASMEQAEISFTQLLGSGQRAQAFLKQLNEFGARTPFELPGLIATSRQLLGAGQAAKDIIPTLTAVGNATGALGLQQEQFEGIMLAVTQAMNKGRLQGEELMQMQERGLPVTALLAKALGVTTKRVGELSQAGKLQSDVVLPKLFDQMQKDYAGSMVKQSRTLNGLWSTFVDTTRNALRLGFEPLIPVIKDALPQAAQILESAIRSVVGFFRDDLGPELGRVKQAWDENGTAILGLVTNMAAGRDGMDQSRTAAQSLADTLVALTNALGDAARLGDQLALGLNNTEEATSSWGSSIHNNVVDPLNTAVRKTGEWLGVNQLVGMVARDVTADLEDLGFNHGRVSHETANATSAAEDHAAALRAEKAAVDDLNDTLKDERNAHINLRQAQLNVQVAEKRLTDLKRQGKQGSLEYRQAQISLDRAQLNLTTTTQDYRASVDKSRGAERLAASASDSLRAAQKRLDLTTLGARRQIILFGGDAQAAFAKLKSKAVNVKASYDVGAPRGIELLVEKGLVRAEGGEVRGPGTTTSDSIRGWLSDQEHVVEADAIRGLGRGSYAAGHAEMADLRRQWRRGYATGGPVVRYQGMSSQPYLDRPPRYDRNLDRINDAFARGFGAFVRDNKESIFGIGKPAIKSYIQSLDPHPYCWGGAGPGCWDCSGIVSDIHLAHMGRPHGHGQRLYTTSSIGVGVGGLKPGLGGVLEIGVTAGTGHMAGRYGGLGFEAESTRTGIKTGAAASRPESFARHYHLARGGPVLLDPREVERLAEAGFDIGGDKGRLRINGRVFDGGGYLRPGRTWSWNGTGSDERVLNPAETRIWERLEHALETQTGPVAAPTPTTVTVEPGAVQIDARGATPDAAVAIRASVEDGLFAVLQQFRTGSRP